MTKVENAEKQMANERKEMRTAMAKKIDAMKKERESETEKMTTLLERMFEQLQAAIAQPVSISTTQPNRNQTTDVNQTTAAVTVTDIVPLLR